MESKIIEKLDLIIDDRYKYSDAVILYGKEVYKFKNFDISIAEHNLLSDADLYLKNSYCLLFRYKGAYITEQWTKELILYVEKDFLIKEIQETMYNLKGFYYMN